jgi:anti-anti-sigma regulatory factor
MQLFDVQKGTLRVHDDLYWDAEDDFQRAVTALLESKERNLTIDLTSVNFIFSPFMGHIVRFCVTAKEKGKNVRVIIGKQIEGIFRSSGLIGELPISVVAQNGA